MTLSGENITARSRRKEKTLPQLLEAAAAVRPRDDKFRQLVTIAVRRDADANGAMIKLADILCDKTCGTVDYALAKNLYAAVAMKGDADAMNRLGRLYYNQGAMGGLLSGEASKKPGYIARARRWWKRAAAKGEQRDAMFNLGLLSSEASSPDMKAACAWWEKAAAKGQTRAMHELGKHYTNENDSPKAAEWFAMGAIEGNKDCIKKLEDAYEGVRTVVANRRRTGMHTSSRPIVDEPTADLLYACGRYYENRRESPDAAECYRLGAMGGHEGCGSAFRKLAVTLATRTYKVRDVESGAKREVSGFGFSVIQCQLQQ